MDIKKIRDDLAKMQKEDIGPMKTKLAVQSSKLYLVAWIGSVVVSVATGWLFKLMVG